MLHVLGLLLVCTDDEWLNVCGVCLMFALPFSCSGWRSCAATGATVSRRAGSRSAGSVGGSTIRDDVRIGEMQIVSSTFLKTCKWYRYCFEVRRYGSTLPGTYFFIVK